MGSSVAVCFSIGACWVRAGQLEYTSDVAQSRLIETKTDNGDLESPNITCGCSSDHIHRRSCRLIKSVLGQQVAIFEL